MNARARPCLIASVFIGVLIVYFLIYLFGFDRRHYSYSPDFRAIEFLSSPKWVTRERFPYGVTRFGAKRSFWNYLFFPVEWVWISVAANEKHLLRGSSVE